MFFYDLYCSLHFFAAEGRFPKKADQDALSLMMSSVSDAENYFMNSVVYGMEFLVIFLICLIFFRLNLFKTISFENPKYQIKAAATGLPVAFLFNFAASFIISVITSFIEEQGTAVPAPDFSVSDKSMLTIFSMFVRLCITAPLFEELIYRGLVISLLKPFNAKLAIFTSAFIFGMSHGNIEQLLPTFAGGLLMAYITVKCKSLLPALLIHVANNFYAFLAELLPDVGIMLLGLLLLATIFFGFAIFCNHVNKRKIYVEENRNCILSTPVCILTVFLNLFMLLYFALQILIYVSSFINANS